MACFIAIGNYYGKITAAHAKTWKMAGCNGFKERMNVSAETYS